MSKFKKILAVATVSLFAFVAVADAQMFSWSRSLSQGSTGADVMNLQKFLNLCADTQVSVYGAGSPGMETSTFGPATKAAVIKFQMKNGVAPAAGYFGPLSQAKAAQLQASGNVCGGMSVPGLPAGCTTTAGFSVINGAPCSGGSTLPAGCLPGYAFSPTTGASCTGSPSSPSTGGLTGTVGSVDDYSLASGLSNEEVGEGEDDVKVAGLDIEVDDSSDIALTAVKLVFDEGTAGSDFEDYAEEVTVWLGSTKIATVDAEDFNDDNDWTQTISLSNARINKGDEETLYVAVTGADNLDSGDANDTWTVDFRSIRFVDAQGASTTEDPGENAVTFSFDTFASANDIEMSVSLSDDSPESQVVDVDTTNDTDNVALLEFEIEADGSDIHIDELPVLVTVSQPSVTDDVDFVINNITLVAGSDEYSESVSTSAGSVATVTFDDLDIDIEDGDTMTFLVKADFNDLEAAQFVAGDTLKVELTEAIVNSIDAEDSTGESISDDDATGTALGDTMTFYDSGIMVTLESVDESVNSNDGNDNDSGEFTIKYKVTAFDGTVYVSDTANATTALDSAIDDATSVISNLYRIEENGTATTADVAALVTHNNTSGAPQSANGNITLEDGESTVVTLFVTRTNSGDANDDGIFQAFLASIGWNTGDSSSVYNNYYFDLADTFKTDPVNLN